MRRFGGNDHRGDYTPVLEGGAGGQRPAEHGPSIFDLMENDMVKRLMWSGLLAGLGALSSIVAQRTAALVWRRFFDEEPPE